MDAGELGLAVAGTPRRALDRLARLDARLSVHGGGGALAALIAEPLASLTAASGIEERIAAALVAGEGTVATPPRPAAGRALAPPPPRMGSRRGSDPGLEPFAARVAGGARAAATPLPDGAPHGVQRPVRDGTAGPGSGRDNRDPAARGGRAGGRDAGGRREAPGHGRASRRSLAAELADTLRGKATGASLTGGPPVSPAAHGMTAGDAWRVPERGGGADGPGVVWPDAPAGADADGRGGDDWRGSVEWHGSGAKRLADPGPYGRDGSTGWRGGGDPDGLGDPGVDRPRGSTGWRGAGDPDELGDPGADRPGGSTDWRGGGDSNGLGASAADGRGSGADRLGDREGHEGVRPLNDSLIAWGPGAGGVIAGGAQGAWTSRARAGLGPSEPRGLAGLVARWEAGHGDPVPPLAHPTPAPADPATTTAGLQQTLERLLLTELDRHGIEVDAG